jgi:RNA polymerase sigma-70 factor (ECF subfamily)
MDGLRVAAFVGSPRRATVVTDEDLMLACRGGSAEAFEAIFERYRAPLWGYFRRRLVDSARAEDLTQETFAAIWRGSSGYEPRALFRTYLYTIAFNLLSAERRRLRTRATDPLTDLAGPASSAEAEHVLWLRQALSRLEESDREIVMLREFEQLSYTEIAALLDIPLNTVRSRLFRARAALRELLLAGPSGDRS